MTFDGRRDAPSGSVADQRGKHEIKDCRQFDPAPVGQLARCGGHKCVRRILKEGSNNVAPRRPLMNISSRSEDLRYLRTGCIAGKPLDGSPLVKMPCVAPGNGFCQASSLARLQTSGSAWSRRWPWHSVTAPCSIKLLDARLGRDRWDEWRGGAACAADCEVRSRPSTFLESTCESICARAFLASSQA